MPRPRMAYFSQICGSAAHTCEKHRKYAYLKKYQKYKYISKIDKQKKKKNKVRHTVAPTKID